MRLIGTWGSGAFAALLALGCQQQQRQRPQEPGGGYRSSAQRIVATPGGVDILTFHGDNARTGWNRRETVLTPENVRPETFGLLARAADVEGEVLGSPLFLSNLTVRDDATMSDVTSDVLFVGTMDNYVYALASDDLHTLWRFDFEGRRPPNASDLQSCQSPYHIGIMSTPVISPDRQTMYVVGRISETAPGDSVLFGYALRTRDGSIVSRFRVGEYLSGGARVRVAADGIDRGNPIHHEFNANQYTQRAALLLENNVLYIGTGGICDNPGFRGWLLAYDVTSLSEQAQPVGVYMPTPGGGGGIWSSGGPASDGRSVFVALGNGRAAMRAGTPEPMRSIADALVRLEGRTLGLDSRACFNVSNPTAPCGAADATNLTNVFAPRHAELLARDNIEDADPWGDLQGPDEDFGSSSPVLLPDPELPENMAAGMGRHLAAVGGKDGFFYLIDRDRMGGIGPSQLRTDADIRTLVGAELHAQELYIHSTSGGIRLSAAYTETRTGRYLYVIGADEVGGRADAPRGLAALRIAPVTDPTPEACAQQFRQIAYHGESIPCGTIWGSTPRPGYEMAWSGSGPVSGASPYVSSNNFENHIVWVSHERINDNGLLVAYAADQGPGTNRVVPPLYRSDRHPDDPMPGTATAFAAPIVANGRVYVTGNGVSVYGLLPARRELPPVAEPTAPPNCAPGVSWESFGRGFMTQYCTSCHAEYNNLPFIQRRRERVRASLLPAEPGERPRMPLVRDESMPPPMPSDEERARIVAWLECGAPSSVARVHAGFEEIASPGGLFVGDGDYLSPNRPGTLSTDRLAGAGFVNPFAPGVPDRAFAFDRTGPATIYVPVPGSGHYAISAYFAENACTTGGPECHTSVDVSLNGAPWITGFDVLGRAGSVRRGVVQSTAIDLPEGSRLTVDVNGNGRLQALEVIRTEPCSGGMGCPSGFVCEGTACVPDETRRDGGVGPDAGAYEGGLPGGDAGPGGTMDSSPDEGPGMARGCACSTTGNSTAPRGALAGLAMVALAIAARRR